MIQIALYGLLALALMGVVGTGVWKVKQWGADEVRAEWAESKAKAQAAADAERKRQDALRTKQDKEVTRRLADAQNRSKALTARLEANLKTARLSTDCRITDELLGDANAALSGKSVSPGTVPSKPKPTPAALRLDARSRP